MTAYNALDLVGKRFGHLVVILKLPNRILPNGNEASNWLCRCDCGNEIECIGSILNSGKKIACNSVCSKKYKAVTELVGKKFGRLTVVEVFDSEIDSKHSSRKCRCICERGNEVVVCSSSLKRENTKSCGCLQLESASRVNVKHGGTNDRLYKIWLSMKSRCYREKQKVYSNYGGRGIQVCEEWLNDYGAFRDWAYDNGYNESAAHGECTIDRINVNGNYCPENCRWVSVKEQNQNKRNNRILTLNGESKTLTEWAGVIGVDSHTVYNRIKKGWPMELVLSSNIKIRYDAKRMLNEYEERIKNRKTT